jgi:magnesium chelatase subunit D
MSLADLGLALRLVAAVPGLGGMRVSGAGPLAQAIEAALATALDGAPLRRVPSHADAAALAGGLDLAATLAAGRPVTAPGLIAATAGGVLVVPGAERLDPGAAALLAAALDEGHVRLLLFDEGEADAVPALTERLGLWLDLRGLVLGAGDAGLIEAPARLLIGAVPAKGAAIDAASTIEALAEATLALGIDSARAAQFALRAARGAAGLAGRGGLDTGDLALAARLVLAPRATRLPQEVSPPAPPPSEAPSDAREPRAQPPQEMIVDAARAALPPDILARLAAGLARVRSARAGKGARQRAPRHGRPVGARAGLPGSARRLALIETLRAAAPWQRLRTAPAGRLAIRRDDLRVRRLKSRQEALTIVAVDASGSAALARLAEAKGAVELLLAQAYVKRAQVALIAFRGREAALLLPPTRSLARARRELAELPGGGGTPVAAGLTAARELAESAARRGRTPYLVVLSDGRANVAADGTPDRARAEEEALAAARALAQAGVASAFIDISPRPRPEGARLAAAMHARYLPLPRADAHAVHAALAR